MDLACILNKIKVNVMMGVYKEMKRVTSSHPNVFSDLCSLEVLVTKVAEGSKAIIKSRTVK